MDKLTELIDAARTLSRDERRRLISELDALEIGEEAASNTPTPTPAQSMADSDPFAALRSLSAAAHSDFANISTDKYAHIARHPCRTHFLG
jgi:hypothetical protein